MFLSAKDMLTLLFEPTTFFRTRMARKGSWPLMIGIPAACVVLNFIGTAIFAVKEFRGMAGIFTVSQMPSIGPRGAVGLAAMSSLFYPVVIAGIFVATICLDVLVGAGRSFSLPKLLELYCLAWVSQVPYFLLRVILAVTFVPPQLLPLRLPFQQWVMDALVSYNDALAHNVAILLAKNLGYASYAWLIVVTMCAYYAIARSTVVRSGFIGSVLYILFFVIGQHTFSQ